MGLQNTCRLACRHNTLYGCLDGLDYLGVGGVRNITHAGSQIGGADKYPINPINLQDFSQSLSALHGINLTLQTNLLIGLLQIIESTPPPRCPLVVCTHPTLPLSCATQ